MTTFHPCNARESEILHRLKGDAREEYIDRRNDGMTVTEALEPFEFIGNDAETWPLKKQMTKEEFATKLKELTVSAGEVLYWQAMQLYNKMEDHEIRPYDDQDYRLARVVLCAVAETDVIKNQFSLECIESDIRRAKRILNQNRA